MGERMTVSVHLASGALFATDYRVVRPLSEGGMGAVYVVEQLSTGVRRALKVMHASLLEDDRARERFVQEARVGGGIKSDHVVQVIAAGVDETSGMPWLAMELLEGESLAERLARGALESVEVAEIFAQLCHAIAAAHDVGVVHRDLKPENIFLADARREGVAFTVKVLDFGIAKLMADAHARTTAAIGTPLWMAPEQTKAGEAIVPATDVWALGLIAFRMLVGRTYWRAANTTDPNAMSVLREVVMEPLPTASARAHEIAPDAKLPDGFDAWFARCVDRAPSARFADARAAKKAFDDVLGIASRPAAPSKSARRDVSAVETMRGDVPLALAATADASTIDRLSSPVPATRGPAAVAKPRSIVLLLAIAATLIAGAAIVVVKMRRGSTATTSSPVASNAPGSASASAPASSSAQPVAKLASSNALAGLPPGSCPDDASKIPGGSFHVGETNEDVTVAPFCMDLVEVTAVRYERCAARGDCPPAFNTVAAPVFDPEDIAEWSKLCNAGRPDHADHPMNCVDWNAATAFCKSWGKRLPTEHEWEWAARGGDLARLYPWGNEDPPIAGKKLLCWAKENAVLGTCPVGAQTDGYGRWSLADMAGNVREWTSSQYADEPEKYVFRGGCFGVMDAKNARNDARAWMYPTNRFHNVGFRCAMTLASEAK